MPELTPQIVDEVVAACRGGAAEASAALHRALGLSVAVHVGAPSQFQSNALPEDFAGAGLVLVFKVGAAGALVSVPESTGLVPAWCAQPDPTGQSKLSTLAQELGMLLLPEQFMPEDFKAARVKNLAGALARGGVGEGASVVPLELSVGDQPRGLARLIWPVPRPDLVLGIAGAKATTPPPSAAPAPAPTPAPSPAPRARPTPPTVPGAGSRRLPAYTRSLLKIQVPVVVTLAEKRQPLGKVVELSPGSIIQFDKSCEEMLDLTVGGQRVACGEAVKVGDKFGLRITSMVLPEERFHPVKSKKAPTGRVDA